MIGTIVVTTSAQNTNSTNTLNVGIPLVMPNPNTVLYITLLMMDLRLTLQRMLHLYSLVTQVWVIPLQLTVQAVAGHVGSTPGPSSVPRNEGNDKMYQLMQTLITKVNAMADTQNKKWVSGLPFLTWPRLLTLA